MPAGVSIDRPAGAKTALLHEPMIFDGAALARPEERHHMYVEHLDPVRPVCVRHELLYYEECRPSGAASRTAEMILRLSSSFPVVDHLHQDVSVRNR